jgi:hypothetical protein
LLLETFFFVSEPNPILDDYFKENMSSFFIESNCEALAKRERIAKNGNNCKEEIMSKGLPVCDRVVYYSTVDRKEGISIRRAVVP